MIIVTTHTSDDDNGTILLHQPSQYDTQLIIKITKKNIKTTPDDVEKETPSFLPPLGGGG